MWIAFDNTTREIISQVNYGSPARQGITNNFSIFAYFDGLDLEDKAYVATISFKKPDGTNVPTTYFMDQVGDENVFDASQASPIGNSIIYFQNGVSYPGFIFTPQDPAILGMAGKYEATIKIYYDEEEVTCGLISFFVANAVYNETYDISATQWSELCRLIPGLGEDIPYVVVVKQIATDQYLRSLGLKNGDIVFYTLDNTIRRVSESDDELNIDTVLMEMSIKNIKDGSGSYSLEQQASTENNSKGGSALGANSVALGLGDTYTFNWLPDTVDHLEILTLLTDTSMNLNWQNMVLEHDGQFRRIVSVDDVNFKITLESAFTNISLGVAFDANIITQVAIGESSRVGGEYCQAFGVASVAEGIACRAVGDESQAFGYFTLANQSYSHAEGMGTIASGVAQTVVGKYNVVNFNDLFIVGNGSENQRSDAFIVRVDGRATIGADPTNDMDVVTKQYADTKVPKADARKIVYATDSDNVTIYTLTYSSALNNNCIVQRDGTQILVPDNPINNNHATSKKYVDSEIAAAITGGALDLTPTQGSVRAATSGGIYDALTNKENLSNKVTTISSSSTDTEYPSAKAVYELEKTNVSNPLFGSFDSVNYTTGYGFDIAGPGNGIYLIYWTDNDPNYPEYVGFSPMYVSNDKASSIGTLNMTNTGTAQILNLSKARNQTEVRIFVSGGSEITYGKLYFKRIL